MKRVKVGVKALVRYVLTIMAVFGMLALSATTVSAAEPYVHDPMADPGAAKDIVIDPNAVYGYAPSPESSRLKDYVSYDWSDPVLVAGMRKQREDYHESMKELYSTITRMKAAGASVKEIAIVVSTRRNELRLLSYRGDPAGLAKVKKSNLENYGNEKGGTPEFFYAKYGSWQTVIEKALSTNAGADACLGLYDKYFDTYAITLSQLPPEPVIPDNGAAVGEYTVESGDNLSRIAERILGDRNQWRVIYHLNYDRIKDPNIIYAGQILRMQ